MSICVQPVQLPDGDRTWTVLGADHRQVGPVEEFLLRHEALLLPDGGERPSISPAVVAAG